MNIKKDDNVIVITGGDKGKSGKVLKVLRDENKVIVDGVNIRKVHMKKTSSKAGSVLELPKPIDASNVKLAK